MALRGRETPRRHVSAATGPRPARAQGSPPRPGAGPQERVAERQQRPETDRERRASTSRAAARGRSPQAVAHAAHGLDRHGAPTSRSLRRIRAEVDVQRVVVHERPLGPGRADQRRAPHDLPGAAASAARRRNSVGVSADSRSSWAQRVRRGVQHEARAVSRRILGPRVGAARRRAPATRRARTAWSGSRRPRR